MPNQKYVIYFCDNFLNESYTTKNVCFRMDATLREITALVKEVNPDARNKGTYFEFSLVAPEIRTPAYRMREIGVTCSGQKGADDNKTLAQARLVKT